ncbi:DUF6544 family protein [Chryseolinea sp. T2]|uniref:DUF6544 family protein n=1 Tax=Chryseolinea sp. T2 TaxID=3129255 RepID=UPI0030774250
MKDVTVLLRTNSSGDNELLTESDLAHVPETVKKYIRQSGAMNKPRVLNFSVLLEGTLRQDEQSPWMKFQSKQYNGIRNPSRLFFLDAVMKRLPVAGYHRFVDGLASMEIRLLSMIRVQHADGPLMNIAETVTAFNDMCVMAPATLIDKRIAWFNISDLSVTATFVNGDVSISADLHFNRDGELIEFMSHDRYALQKDGSMQRYPWLTPLKAYQNFAGMRLSSYAEAIVKYPSGDFCYGKFKIVDVRYNVDE